MRYTEGLKKNIAGIRASLNKGVALDHLKIPAELHAHLVAENEGKDLKDVFDVELVVDATLDTH